MFLCSESQPHFPSREEDQECECREPNHYLDEGVQDYDPDRVSLIHFHEFMLHRGEFNYIDEGIQEDQVKDHAVWEALHETFIDPLLPDDETVIEEPAGKVEDQHCVHLSVL